MLAGAVASSASILARAACIGITCLFAAVFLAFAVTGSGKPE